MTRKSRIHFPDVLTCAEHYSFGGTQVGGRRVSRIERIDYKLACEPYIVYFCGIFDNAVSTTHHPIQHLIIHLSIIINEYQNFVKLNGIFKVLHEKIENYWRVWKNVLGISFCLVFIFTFQE